ncbi:MAG: hypothetical protein J6U01_06845 [Clostridia bacterium]|nr:hypothetical protein [Clostridia bacterium]
MKVFTLTIELPNPILHPFRAFRLMGTIAEIPGRIGRYLDGRTMVIAFATVTHAEKARAILGKGRRCRGIGKYVMDADLDEEKSALRIHGPVCGIENVDPEDLAMLAAEKEKRQR